MQKPNKSSIKRALKIGVPTVAAVAALGTAGVMAYFTDTESVTNNFQVAAPLSVDLTEPQWDALPDTDNNGIPDEAQAMVPLQTVAKDPKVTNTCDDVDAYLFLQVKVPVATVKTVGSDGSVSAAAQHELFTYTVNSSWTEIGSVSYENGYAVHTYKYNSVVAPKETTDTLFDNVTLINLVDEALGAQTVPEMIDVTAYGIQSLGFDSAEAAWSAYSQQNNIAVENES